MKKLFTFRLSLVFVLLAAAVLPGRGQTVIAQQTDYSAGGSGFSNYNDPDFGLQYQGVAQTFKSLATGTLGTIQFYVGGTSSTGTTDIAIYSCSSLLTWGTLLGTKTGVPINGNGWTTADVTALNIPVTAGNYYGFKLLPQDGIQTNIDEAGNASADLQAWYIPQDGSTNVDAGYNLAFKAMSASTLPVTLSFFTAQKQGNNALLQWSTSSEQNSKDFTVQYSADGNSWSNLAVLPAAGNSNAMRNYSYAHTNPAIGDNYYRLLQTDMDGKSNYTEVKTLKFGGSDPGFTVMANPVSNGVLSVHVNKTTGLSLYSSDGRLIWKKQLNAGVQNVDISGCGKGIFLLKGDGATEKLLVK